MSATSPDGATGQNDHTQHEQLRLEIALECARMGAWDWEIGPQRVTWDRQMHLLFGITPGSFGGRHEDFLNLVHPADRSRVGAEMVFALDQCAEFDSEFRVIWAEDGTHIIRMRARASCDADRKPLRVVGVSWDVTERRRTEADLERKRSLLDALMDALPDKIYFKDRESRFIGANKAKLAQHGFNQESEILGKTDFDLFLPERARQAMEDERRTISTGEPLIDHEEKNIWRDGSETWVSSTKLPLRDVEGHIIGTFGLSRDITRRKRTEDELARTAQELRVKNETLEEDLTMAHELQSAMLPQRYPRFPAAGDSDDGSVVRFYHFYNPSMSVSGDFFDVFKISDTKAGIFIGDVMGHGVRAALVAAMIHTLIGEAHSGRENPDQLMAHLNRTLREALKSSLVPVFASAFYVIVDLQAGELRYSNAGHPNPLLMPRGVKAGAPVSLNGIKPGPALGLFDDAQYVSGHHALSPHDVLLLFTDGLFEVEGPRGEFYDYQQLSRAVGQRSNLPTEELCRGLINEVQQFSASKEFDDDVCLVAMEVEHLASAR